MRNKIYRYLINFFCLFVPVKQRREKRKQLLLLPEIHKKNLKSKVSYRQFLSGTIKEKSVLIVEPNPYHFELQPGFCNYFQELGYHVDLLAQPVILDDSPFIKYPNPPNIFYLSSKYQKKALRLEKIQKYDYVFLSSSVLWGDNVRDSFINFLGYEPNSKHGLLMVEHNVIPYVKEYGHEKYVEDKRSFTLGGQQNIPILNPHYFGNYTVTLKSKLSTFVAVINDPENKKFLFETCRALIKKNITNFKIIVAGRTVITEIPEDLKEIISFTGKIKFVDLWEIYNEADFFLPMLNPEINHNQRYREGTVTGSWQIILGFLKPALIHSQFANYYQLNHDNSIVYHFNAELVNAIQKAISTPSEDYGYLQKNLKDLSEKIYQDSLKNLRNIIKS
ncbi:hypothetical protein [Chryseobacterium sp. CFBP8996]|jgi:hypothetical protein|uniref:hypothetical protein n=1 Tax=Chryseobacterium sp. CFBP8996 TaxID=3096529 RepID=UPI002A6ADA80|nr:hypothetical protein [Chryseobacterium sp. CFBP8996]MDY0929514.1 hypothetical protein [Chryseobacterium sp. CFBP8996]